MDAQEFANLQEALVWLLSPVVQLLLGVTLGASFLTAVFLFFARASKYLTAVKRR